MRYLLVSNNWTTWPTFFANHRHWGGLNISIQKLSVKYLTWFHIYEKKIRYKSAINICSWFIVLTLISDVKNLLRVF